MSATPQTPPLNRDEVQQIAPGTTVQVQYRKYDGTQHWHHFAEYLGYDEHAHWVGAEAGTIVAKPGRQIPWQANWVIAFPHDAGFTMNVNEQGPKVPTRYYCDITTPPTWHREKAGLGVHMIDLDLDVVMYADYRLVVEDEDELREHSQQMGYPKELVTAAEASCARVHAGFLADEEPFTTVGQQWLSQWQTILAERTSTQ